MNWYLWGLLLLAQAASFTWTSRSRNSGSVKANLVASTFSNGIWFLGQMFVVNVFYVVKESGDFGLIFRAAAFYTVISASGSAAMQQLLLKVEKGKTRVGHYEQKKPKPIVRAR
jgi:hypothetical protein